MRFVAFVTGYLVLLSIFGVGLWWLITRGGQKLEQTVEDMEDE